MVILPIAVVLIHTIITAFLTLIAAMQPWQP